MKKLALTVVAGLIATALIGASAVSAVGDEKIHTKRFVSRDIASHSLGPRTFAGAAVDRRAGHVIGYDSFTGHFYPQQDRATIWASYALRNGSIAVVVHVNTASTTSSGRILKLVIDKNNNSIAAVGWTAMQIPIDSRITLYSKIGDLFPFLCALASVRLTGFTLVRPRRGRKESPEQRTEKF